MHRVALRVAKVTVRVWSVLWHREIGIWVEIMRNAPYRRSVVTCEQRCELMSENRLDRADLQRYPNGFGISSVVGIMKNAPIVTALVLFTSDSKQSCDHTNDIASDSVDQLSHPAPGMPLSDFVSSQQLPQRTEVARHACRSPCFVSPSNAQSIQCTSRTTNLIYQGH